MFLVSRASSWARTLLSRRIGLVVTLVAAIIGASTVGLTAAVTTGVIYACVNNGSGTIKIIASGETCPNNWTLLSWSQESGQGPAGPTGPTGPTGVTGPTGPTGPAGTATGFGTNTNWAQAGRGGECFLGEVILSAGSVTNGVPANGQLLPISQNQALFALLGTTHGGDGQTTFALPDLRAVAPNNLTYSICTEGIFPSPN